MHERFSIQIDKLPKREVLRALGYKNQELDSKLEGEIESLIDETLRLSEIRVAFKTGELLRDNGLSLFGIELPGRGIKEHLEGSDRAALFALTLGSGIESRLRRYSLTELDKAVVMDAAASTLVEAACDEVSEAFEEELKSEGLYTTERFSPGYSDLPLEIQPKILRELDTPRRIGLNVSEHNLLLPRKSVTAFIGIRDEPRPFKSRRCENCIKRGKCKFGLCYFENNAL